MIRVVGFNPLRNRRHILQATQELDGLCLHSGFDAAPTELTQFPIERL